MAAAPQTSATQRAAPCGPSAPCGLRPKPPAPWVLYPQTAALRACAPKPLQWLRSLMLMFHPLNIHRKPELVLIGNRQLYIWHWSCGMCHVRGLMLHLPLICWHRPPFISCSTCHVPCYISHSCISFRISHVAWIIDHLTIHVYHFPFLLSRVSFYMCQLDMLYKLVAYLLHIVGCLLKTSRRLVGYLNTWRLFEHFSATSVSSVVPCLSAPMVLNFNVHCSRVVFSQLEGRQLLFL